MKPAPCHPNRPHVAKGLCKVCYNREHNRTSQSDAREASKKKARVSWKKTPQGRVRTMLAQARTNVRGIPCNLELSDVVIPERCPILGIPLDSAAVRPADNLPSLDRIDNTKGYIKGNVWVISWRANFIKGDATHDELRALVKALDAHVKVST